MKSVDIYMAMKQAAIRFLSAIPTTFTQKSFSGKRHKLTGSRALPLSCDYILRRVNCLLQTQPGNRQAYNLALNYNKGFFTSLAT